MSNGGINIWPKVQKGKLKIQQKLRNYDKSKISDEEVKSIFPESIFNF